VAGSAICKEHPGGGREGPESPLRPFSLYVCDDVGSVILRRGCQHSGLEHTCTPAWPPLICRVVLCYITKRRADGAACSWFVRSATFSFFNSRFSLEGGEFARFSFERISSPPWYGKKRRTKLKLWEGGKNNRHAGFPSTNNSQPIGTKIVCPRGLVWGRERERDRVATSRIQTTQPEEPTPHQEALQLVRPPHQHPAVRFLLERTISLVPFFHKQFFHKQSWTESNHTHKRHIQTNTQRHA
jgi:hypothetical protein